jgi:hypothetical protein
MSLPMAQDYRISRQRPVRLLVGRAGSGHNRRIAKAQGRQLKVAGQAIALIRVREDEAQDPFSLV